MPEQHREDASDAEHQRKGNEVPLFAQEIDIRIAKKFHAAKPQILLIRYTLPCGLAATGTPYY